MLISHVCIYFAEVSGEFIGLFLNPGDLFLLVEFSEFLPLTTGLFAHQSHTVSTTVTLQSVLKSGSVSSPT